MNGAEGETVELTVNRQGDRIAFIRKRAVLVERYMQKYSGKTVDGVTLRFNTAPQ